MKKIIYPFIAILFSISVSTASAQEASPPECSQPDPMTKYEDILSQGYSIGIQGGYGVKAWDNEHYRLDTALIQPYFTLPVSGVLMEDWITRGVLEYKLEVPLGLITSLNDRAMAGLSPIGFRYDFTGLRSAFVPYALLSLGMVYLDVPRQVQGTKYDFIADAAVGAQYFLTDGWAISAECRYLHLSNGGIKEPNRGQNYLFGLIGVCRYFR